MGAGKGSCGCPIAQVRLRAKPPRIDNEAPGLPKAAAERVTGVEEAMANACQLARDAGVRLGSGADPWACTKTAAAWN